MSARLLAGASLLALSAALAACATSPITGGGVAAEAGAVLDANRAASGTPPAEGTLSVTYGYAGQGLSGTVATKADLAQGWFVDTQDLGLLKGANGYDGARPWMVDSSGAPSPEEGGDKRQLAVNEAYRDANLWWRADRGGAAIAYAGREPVGGAPADHLMVTPKAGKPFDAWFDAASHQLVQLREMNGFQTFTTGFSDYRSEAGMVLAHTQTVDDGSGPQGAQTLTLKRTAVTAAEPATAYAMPAGLPDDHAVAGGSTTVPFLLNNNHVFVDVKVNGKGPFHFIVDTGGHNIVTPETAKALKIGSVGAVTANGAGDKSSTAGFGQVDSLSVGGASVTGQVVTMLEFSPYELEGLNEGGMLGTEFIHRFVLRFDYGASRLTIIDPATFDPKDAGTPVPFVFYDHLPQVQGTLDGRPARFDIDTGSRAELTVPAPFVASAGLRAAYPNGAERVDGWGVGGPVKSFVARAGRVTLGDVAVTGPVIGLAKSKGGAFSDPNFEGNVGSGLLKRFVVTFDYAHQLMYLRPLATPLADTGTFDRSGLWINKAQGGFKIVFVAEGAPAEAVGLKPDDVITAIDGVDAARTGLSDARSQFRVWPAGKAVALTVRRGGETKPVTLILRDQVPPHAG